MKTSRPSRFSREDKEEELFTIVRNLSLETQGAEGKKFQVNSFLKLKDKFHSSIQILGLCGYHKMILYVNFIYPCKSEERYYDLCIIMQRS